jgi:hypothetical protein
VYRKYLQPEVDQAAKKHCKAGAGFGFGQFAVYAIFACAFFFGGVLIEANWDEENKVYTVNPETIMMTIFCILFGAS